MNNHQASYSRLLEKESRESRSHDLDAASFSDDVSLQHERYTPLPRTSWMKRLVTALLVITAVAYTIGSLAFMVVTYRSGHYVLPAPEPPYTPAVDAIRYTIVKSEDGFNEDMEGFPSMAHDKAWLHLVQPAASRVTYEEMRLALEDPEHSVALSDEDGGYLTTLGIYHELHCLRRLKMYMHKDFYYPTLAYGSDDDTQEINHLHHCIESIRLSLMCSANTATYSYKWPDNPKVQKPELKTNSKRMCVDWGLLEQWTRNRSLGVDPKMKRPFTQMQHDKKDHD